jgi:SAM-dependent methyltransferase
MEDRRQFRAGQGAMWDAGDFAPFADMIAPVAEHVVRRLALEPGERVVDVGCGTGNVALRAARAGARVTGVDVAPGMLERAAEAARALGVDLDLREGDADDLPLPDGCCDAVGSNFGSMFAPLHDEAVAEMLRVLRPGGRFAMTAWVDEGAVGRFLRLPVPYLPPPPDFVQPPTLWGDRAHIHEMFAGQDVTGLEVERAEVDLPFASVDAAVELYTTRFGPLVFARERLEPEGTWDDFTAELREFFGEMADDRGHVVMPGPYFLISGRRAG